MDVAKKVAASSSSPSAYWHFPREEKCCSLFLDTHILAALLSNEANFSSFFKEIDKR